MLMARAANVPLAVVHKWNFFPSVPALRGQVWVNAGEFQTIFTASVCVLGQGEGPKPANPVPL